jgi:DNA-binding transcriptional LysR family regulator
MRLDKVDLNLFVLFDAIYREKSVTRAAAQLNLTQPAASNALSRLRQTFGDPLFVRVPGGMAPTPVADSVVGSVREALTLLSRSVGVNAQFDPARAEKTFRLGMNDLAESLILPRLHAALVNLAPNISVTSYYVARESATEELKAGLIDLLLDAPVVNTRELNQQPLAEFPYVLAVRRGHPLMGESISMEQYLGGQHLHVSSRRRGRGQVDIALNRLAKKRNTVMRVQNYLVAARITQETDLLWTAPRSLVERLPLASVALPFQVEALAWNLYWSKNVEDDPANRWMRKLIQTVAQDVAASQSATQSASQSAMTG